MRYLLGETLFFIQLINDPQLLRTTLTWLSKSFSKNGILDVNHWSLQKPFSKV